MSVSYYVLFNQPVPSIQEWQSAISRQGITLTFSKPYDISRLEGSLEMNWRGEQTGFEIFPCDSKELSGRPVMTTGPWRTCIYLSTSARLLDVSAMTRSALALAKVTSGVIIDEISDDTTQGSELDSFERELDEFFPNPDITK